MFSPLPLLADFGVVVTINIAVAVLAALVVVPPLLTEADRRGWLAMGPAEAHAGVPWRDRVGWIAALRRPPASASSSPRRPATATRRPRRPRRTDVRRGAGRPADHDDGAADDRPGVDRPGRRRLPPPARCRRARPSGRPASSPACSGTPSPVPESIPAWPAARPTICSPRPRKPTCWRWGSPARPRPPEVDALLASRRGPLRHHTRAAGRRGGVVTAVAGAGSSESSSRWDAPVSRPTPPVGVALAWSKSS